MRQRRGERGRGRWMGARRRATAGAVLALGLAMANAGGAQRTQTQTQTPAVPTYPGPAYNRPAPMGNDPMDARGPFGPQPNGARLEKMREEDRRKRLLADTARLVELTNELKAQVDKAAKDELSLDVVRKAAEIEKLARDVKERMKS
jgi:hypothetical protein